MPRIDGIDKIRILETKVNWQEIKKCKNGEVIVREIQQPSHKKKESFEQSLVKGETTLGKDDQQVVITSSSNQNLKSNASFVFQPDSVI